MAAPAFNELIHPATRLSIVALLAAVDWADFAYVRDQLKLSDSALSKQIATLEDAGYVLTERTLANRRHRVRVRLTEAGRDAFEGHVAAIQAIVNGSAAAVPPPA
jgi:DNA-binding MarR family transcriptional regulator